MNEKKPSQDAPAKNGLRVLIITQALDQKHPILGFFVRWVLEFARQCDQVTVICLEEGMHHVPDNVTVYSLGKEKRRSKTIYLLKFYRAVLKSVEEYDIVFVHMNPEYVILGSPIWWAFHKKVGLWYLHKHVGYRLKIAAWLTDIIFTASRESFRLASEKVHIVGHGIDTDFFPDLEREEKSSFSIVSVGRLSPSKGHEIAIEAVQALVEGGKDVMLTIVGGPAVDADHSYQEKLEQLVQKHGLSERVQFAGGIPHADLPAFLYAADAFVHTSDTGSLDKVALEAMASGLPVISSNDSVVAMLDAYPQLRFKKGNVEELVEALRKLMALPQSGRAMLGEELRVLVREHHSLPGLVERVCDIYKQS